MKINVPENINEIKLEQWQKLMGAADGGKFTQESVLKIIFGIRRSKLNQMKSKDVANLSNQVVMLFTKKSKFERIFVMDGIKYGIVPNLDEMTFGELTDIDENVSPDKYHRLMSILYRPIVKEALNTYSVEDYKGTNDKMLEMPLGVALGCLDFFFRLGQQLVSDTLKSATQEKVASLPKNGVGISPSTH